MNDQSSEKEYLANIFKQQIEAFHEQYDIQKFEEADERGKTQFIIELKHWIYKFETGEQLKKEHLSLKNVLIKFTEAEIFQYEAQLETIRVLLPFLRAQLKLAQEKELPKIRNNPILPLGSITAGEVFLRVAEEMPVIAQLSEEERINSLNQSVQEVAELVKGIDPTAYTMDTNTLNSLIQQQIKETEENYKKVLKLSEDALKAIKNALPDLPHKDKVILQQRSVEIQIKLAEYRKWFAEYNIPLPTDQDESAVKNILLDICKKECEKRELQKGVTLTREQKYSIAKAIGLKKLGKMKSFKSKNPAYHRISKMLSELGYCRKSATKYN